MKKDIYRVGGEVTGENCVYPLARIPKVNAYLYRNYLFIIFQTKEKRELIVTSYAIYQ